MSWELLAMIWLLHLVVVPCADCCLALLSDQVDLTHSAPLQLVRSRDSASGLYGAKITGGGSGGTVCVLGDDSPAAEARGTLPVSNATAGLHG